MENDSESKQITITRRCWITELGKKPAVKEVGHTMELPKSDANYLVAIGKAVEGKVDVKATKEEKKGK